MVKAKHATELENAFKAQMKGQKALDEQNAGVSSPLMRRNTTAFRRESNYKKLSSF